MTSFTKIGKDTITGRVVLHFKKATPALMNALRRSIHELVPTMAIEYIEFRKNNSILYDEMLAHRLGLLPLTTDLKSYTIWDRATPITDAPAQATLKMTLKAKGPKTVYSKDIKSKDPAVIPVEGETPLVTLLKGQELEMEATAILGTGMQHSKFAPGKAWYRHAPIITIDDKKVSNPEQFAQESPIDIFTVSKGKLVIDEKKLEKALVENASLEALHAGPITVGDNPEEFIFHYEPYGQLSPKETIITALTELSRELEQLATALEKATRASQS